MTSAPAVHEVEEFSHEAFLYSSLPEFLDEVCGFVREGLERDESVLIATSGERLTALRALLDGVDDVELADMEGVGANPARIIPVWRDFLATNVSAGRRVRGVGEPIWAGRTEAELAECHQHESLLNLAFEGRPAWRLMCPYDVTALPGDVIEEARANHPLVLDDGSWYRSDRYRTERPRRALRHRPLPPPGEAPTEMAFGTGDLCAVRRLVETRSVELGLPAGSAEDLVLCVNEIAGNSLLHGGGDGVLRIWGELSTLICEVADSGTIADPLVGRQTPSLDRVGGRGLWLANQLCDLVQIRSGASGTVVRLHVRLA